jgi:hypothetical protein
MMKNKKGIMLSEAFGAVLTVLLVGLLVIVAIYLFSALGNSFTIVPIQGGINETSYINSSAYSNTSLSGIYCNYQGITMTTVYNLSDGAVISAPNYTVTNIPTGFNVTNKTAMAYNNTRLNYQVNYGGSACTATNVMITQFATYPALVGLLGTIIFLSLVIGVLVASFAFGGKQGV